MENLKFLEQLLELNLSILDGNIEEAIKIGKEISIEKLVGDEELKLRETLITSLGIFGNPEEEIIKENIKDVKKLMETLKLQNIEPLLAIAEISNSSPDIDLTKTKAFKMVEGKEPIEFFSDTERDIFFNSLVLKAIGLKDKVNIKKILDKFKEYSA